MSNTISDSTYHRLSDYAYDEKKIKNTDEWQPIHPKGATLHDSATGFDATVFQHKDTGEIIVAYRGTEGTGPLNRSLPDFYTDVKYIAAGANPLQDGEKINPVLVQRLYLFERGI
ncbi:MULTISPECIES: hypothetical protein [unclassified Bacillus (in: firmicutes)]|uniref:hypothetical protein n=1 Tax=unclassified Bacillus (in: firmicutes) TaxID=185979 RepID=UPI0030F4F0D0